MKVGGDGSIVLIELIHFFQSGKFDVNVPGRVLRYHCDSRDKDGTSNQLEGHTAIDRTNYFTSPWIVNSDGNLVAVGLPWYDVFSGQYMYLTCSLGKLDPLLLTTSFLEKKKDWEFLNLRWI